ncbi:hypothetical protein S40288_10572 [Stachybotrys chartarum IBT 40288]|nr:hypothetical protein S40288_10572 [Stachybotrys chartarum IBT 40288]
MAEVNPKQGQPVFGSAWRRGKLVSLHPRGTGSLGCFSLLKVRCMRWSEAGSRTCLGTWTGVESKDVPRRALHHRPRGLAGWLAGAGAGAGAAGAGAVVAGAWFTPTIWLSPHPELSWRHLLPSFPSVQLSPGDRGRHVQTPIDQLSSS